MGAGLLRRVQAPTLATTPGLAHRYAADALVLADNAAVASWTDTAPSGAVAATQATGANQPTFKATAGPNSKPCVHFNGTTNRLQATYGATVAQPSTMFVVVKAAPDGTTREIIDGIASANRNMLRCQSDNTLRIFAGNTTQSLGTADSAWHVLAFVFNGVTSFGRVDGVRTYNAGSGPGTVGATGITIGSRYDGAAEYFNGDIAEIMVCTGALSVGQISVVERLLASKYALTLAEYGVYYVDSVAGSDSNHGGLAGKDFATINKAVLAVTALADSKGPFTIKVKPNTTAAPLRDGGIVPLFTWTGDAPLSVVSQTLGTKWYLYASTKVTAGWTNTSGSIYSHAVTVPSGGLNVVVVTTLNDSDGNFTKLLPNTATPTTPAAGQFGVSGATLYVNLPNASSPNTHTVEVGSNNYTALCYGIGKLYLRDGWLRFGNSANVQAGFGTGVASNIEADNCNADYAGNQDWYAFGTGGAGVCTITARNCNGDNCVLNDGFSTHGDPGVHNRLDLTNCSGGYNGVGSTLTGQTFTGHDDCIVNVTGGRGHHNGDSGAKFVNNCQANMSGVEIDHNYWGRTLGALSANEAGLDYFDSTTSGTVTNCNVHDNLPAGVYTKVGSAVTVDAATLASSGVGHGNGRADVIQGA